MINRIELFFSSGSASSGITFLPGAVTVFVGPNNSGKSLVLREIGSALFDPADPRSSVPWEGYIAVDRRHIVRRVEAPEQSFAEVRHCIPKADSTGGTYLGTLLGFGGKFRHPITSPSSFGKSLSPRNGRT